MGKGSSGGTNTVYQNSTPPADVTAAYDQALSMAGNAASQPLQQYSGNTVAGLTPDQLAAFQTVDNTQGIAQPYINQASGMINNATQPIWNNVQQFSPSAVAAYQNPYTQQVVNTTMAEAQQQDAIQQQGLTGNAISKGAWGGDRAGIAAAALAGQQDMANNQTIAGLNSQGYGQALSEFNTQQQNQIGANEANAWLNSQGAAAEAQLGTTAQNDALTGASAQLQQGTLQQQQNQANLNVPYQQFLAQQAYPFQTAQYYSGIAEGIGGGSGGTSSSTQPAPNTLSQSLGAASSLGTLGYLGYLAYTSDRRVKENIKKIGTLKGKHGEYPIYTFNYIGSKAPQVGVMAQDVEKINKAAVTEINGIKHVYYQKLKTGGRVAYAPGGGIGGGVPDLSVSFIPNTASGASHGMGPPAPPKPMDNTQADTSGMSNLSNIIQLAQADKKVQAGALPAAGINGNDLQDLNSAMSSFNNWTPNASNMTWDNVGGMSDAATLPVFNRGGGIARRAFDDGGAVGGIGGLPAGANPMAASQYQTLSQLPAEKLQEIAARTPPNSPQGQLVRRALTQKQLMPTANPAPQAGIASTPSTSMSQSMPQGFADGGDTGDQDDSVQVTDLPAPTAPISQSVGIAAPASADSSNADRDQKMKAVMPILAAGLGMMAGRSPYAAVNIGQGGLKGIEYYQKQQDTDLTAKKLADQAEEVKNRLAQEKDFHADTVDYQNRSLANDAAYRKSQLGLEGARVGLERDKLTQPDYTYENGTQLGPDGQPVVGTWAYPSNDPDARKFFPGDTMNGLNRKSDLSETELNNRAVMAAQKDAGTKWSRMSDDMKQKKIDYYKSVLTTGAAPLSTPVVNGQAAPALGSNPSDPLNLGLGK